MKKGKTTSNYAKGKKEILEQRKVQMKVLFACTDLKKSINKFLNNGNDKENFKNQLLHTKGRCRQINDHYAVG
jgi:hypothetical protein